MSATSPTIGAHLPEITAPTVDVIAASQFFAPDDIAWETDAEGGEALAEFAGRACYESWDKPNPSTATNASFLRHIIDVGHLSVLEHGVVTMYFRGVSRTVTHELVRHRHFSYSQLSPRYMPDGEGAYIEPPIIADDPELHEKFVAATRAAERAYEELLDGLERKLDVAGNHRVPHKRTRQAAHAVLPGSLETRIVVTGNYRAWRHFIAIRGTDQADNELRAVVIMCLRNLQRVAPHVFSDFVITTLPDGTQLASSPLVTET